LTASIELPADATRAEMVRAILWARAVALQSVGRDKEMLEVLARARSLPGKGKGQEAIRALAMSALARQPADPARLAHFIGVAERESRDSAALQLAHAIVLREAEGGTHRDALKSQLAWLRERLPTRDAAQIEALVTSLQPAPDEGEQRLALGRIDVVRTPEPPPEPAVLLDLPEPASLLAIPGPDGALHDWFEARGPP